MRRELGLGLRKPLVTEHSEEEESTQLLFLYLSCYLVDGGKYPEKKREVYIFHM